MTSRITKTDGSILTTIADGTVDNTTSLILIGKNYAGYGDFLNENFVHLLENAASEAAPTAPLVGQLWWDKISLSLKVWTGDAFKILSSSASQDTAPTNSIVGDLWWDTFNSQLNVYNGSGWTLIGPAFTTAIGTSGTIVDSITDDNGDAHIAIKVFIEETLVAVISKDSSYFVANADATYDSLTSVGPGFNLVSNVAINDITFYGTATDATTLANVAATNYARTDLAAGQETFYNTVAISNNGGLTIGTNRTFTSNINGNSVVLTNIVSDASSNPFVIKTNVAGTLTETLLVTSNAEVKLSRAPDPQTGSNLAIATMKNIKEVGGEALQRNGSLTITGSLSIDANVGSETVNLGTNDVRFGSFYTANVIARNVQSAILGNAGTTITANSVSSAFIGNTGTIIQGNTITAAGAITTLANVNSAGVTATTANIGTVNSTGYYLNGYPFTPGVATLNGNVGNIVVSGTSGITVSNASATSIVLSITSGYNGFGLRTVSTSSPTGGSNGDVWYQI